MDGDLRPSGFTLTPDALGRLMPVFLSLDASCRLAEAGPTLVKLLGPAAMGKRIDEVFFLRHSPREVTRAALLRRTSLLLTLRASPHTTFKGVPVPFAGSGGVLINLSFGVGLREAVRDHGLSAADFAGTDLAIELLYLFEAKTAVMGELRRMADRLKTAKARAEIQAFTDPLTGLGNRRAMEDALARLLAAGTGFTLLHADLDFFKQVNDTMGHAAGDHVLRATAAILRNAVRAGDSVSRVGGDEFVLLIAGATSAASLVRLGRDIFGKMARPITFAGRNCPVAMSIGAAIVPAGRPIRGDTALARADVALYASKHSGRSRLTLWVSDSETRELVAGPQQRATERRQSR